MAFSNGDRVKILSGTYAGKEAVVLAKESGGRVPIFMDGFTTSSGIRAYVPSSLQPLMLPIPPVVSVNPSGEPPPVGNLSGWRHLFVDDFNKVLTVGQFPANTDGKWNSYPASWQGSMKNSYYDAPNVVTQHDSCMDMWCRTKDGKRITAAPYPRLPDDPAVEYLKSWDVFEGYYTDSLRVAVRAKAQSMPGYKTAWLLWPKSDVWPRDGEVDFPEGDLKSGAHVMGFMHRQNGVNGGDQEWWDAGAQWTDGQWHTYVMEWRRGQYCQFFCDGRSSPKWTSRVPATPMRYVMQTETELNGIVPGPDIEGHLLVDWVSIWVAV